MVIAGGYLVLNGKSGKLDLDRDVSEEYLRAIFQPDVFENLGSPYSARTMFFSECRIGLHVSEEHYQVEDRERST